MTTFRENPGYADGVPGSTGRFLWETAAGEPRGVAPADIPGLVDWTADQGATNIHIGNIPDLSSLYQAAHANLTAFSGKTAPSGAVVGTTDTQTLTGKSIDAAQLTGTIDVARLPVLPSSVQIVSSGGIANLTAPQQAEIGDGSVVTTTDGRRWIYSGTGGKTTEASYIELADITPEWAVIANKPSFATVATSGAYDDLSGLPTLGTAADNDEADFATATQGVKADSAVQSPLTGAFDANGQEIESPVLVGHSELSPAASVSGAVTRSYLAGSVQELTLTGNVTSLGIADVPPSGRACSITFILRQDATGGRSWSHPLGIIWPGGLEPTLDTAANAVDIVSYLTRDGGTTWCGFGGAAGSSTVSLTSLPDVGAALAYTAGRILVADGTDYEEVAISGDATLAASGALTVGPLANSKLADMAEATFKMRAASAGTGPPINGTAAQAKTALAIAVADVSGAALATDVDALKGPVNTTSGTSYTLVIGDAYGYRRFTSASAVALTVPTNASVAFAIGTVITIRQAAAGAITISGAGTTLNAPQGGTLVTAGQGATASLKKVATDTWDIIGQTVAA